MHIHWTPILVLNIHLFIYFINIHKYIYSGFLVKSWTKSIHPSIHPSINVTKERKKAIVLLTHHHHCYWFNVSRFIAFLAFFWKIMRQLLVRWISGKRTDADVHHDISPHLTQLVNSVSHLSQISLWQSTLNANQLNSCCRGEENACSSSQTNHCLSKHTKHKHYV